MSRVDRRAETANQASALLEMKKLVEIDMAELRIWRESYPRQAWMVREAARAKVEGRAVPDFKPQMYG